MMARTALKTVSALALLTAATVWWMAPGAAGQASPMPSTKSGDWTHYTADVRGSRYAPLD
jgi:glucose dehydrogenase